VTVTSGVSAACVVKPRGRDRTGGGTRDEDEGCSRSRPSFDGGGGGCWSSEGPDASPQGGEGLGGGDMNLLL